MIEQLPKGEKVCMRATPTCAYNLLYLFPIAWSIHFWLIDANSPVLSPLLTTNVSHLKPNVVTNEVKSEATIEAANKYLSAATTMVIMDPYEAQALMRFTAFVSYNGLPSKSSTLIDTTASLNFVRK